MRHMRLVLALTIPFVIVTAGCGGSSAQTQSTTGTGAPVSSAQGSGNIESTDPNIATDCHDEVMTGSSIPRHVCRTKAQQQLDREGGQDWVNRPRANTTTK